MQESTPILPSPIEGEGREGERKRMHPQITQIAQIERGQWGVRSLQREEGDSTSRPYNPATTPP